MNDPDAYNFDPRSLLINILTMFANMSGEETFLRHVVSDTRSYKTETFDKAVRILGDPKKGIVIADQDKRERFEGMVARMKEMKNLIDEEEVGATGLS